MITLLMEFFFLNESNAKYKKKPRMASISVIIKFFFFKIHFRPYNFSFSHLFENCSKKAPNVEILLKKKTMASGIISEMISKLIIFFAH